MQKSDVSNSKRLDIEGLLMQMLFFLLIAIYTWTDICNECSTIFLKY